MSDSTSLRAAAHAAHMAYCEQQNRMRMIERRDRERRANRELEKILELPPAAWQVPTEAAPVNLVTTIEGITFGVSFDDGDVELRVHVLGEEGDMYWPVVYDLARLGYHLAEDAENREHFARITGDQAEYQAALQGRLP
jgi:hypothetical protein